MISFVPEQLDIGGVCRTSLCHLPLTKAGLPAAVIHPEIPLPGSQSAHRRERAPSKVSILS
jgi:hypothetical protein